MPNVLRAPLFLCLVFACIAGCAEENIPVDTRVVVESAPPLVQDVDVKLQYPVELQADEAVSIAPVAVSGFLRRVLVDVGDEVDAGQLLALVDCREYAAKRTQAETMITKRKAQVDESRSQLERLEKMGQGLVAPAEIDRAEADARVAEAELADARAKLSEAGQRQGYCSMTAPFGGFITERFLDPGAMVSPGGQPVVKIVKSRDVRVVASIIEEDAPKVFKGSAAEIVLQAYPDNPFGAEVARLGRSLDPSTRTLRVEMSIPKSTDLMLPGMTGRASIVIGTREGAMLVPITAVLKLEEVAYVYVVEEDEQGVPRARRVEVELGVDLGDWIEVVSGITAEAMVIYTGRDLVDDGTQVEISPTPPTPATPESTQLREHAPPGEAAQAERDAAEAEEAKDRRSRRKKAKSKAKDGEEAPAAASDAGDEAEDGEDGEEAAPPVDEQPAKARPRKAAKKPKRKQKADSSKGKKPDAGSAETSDGPVAKNDGTGTAESSESEPAQGGSP